MPEISLERVRATSEKCKRAAESYVALKNRRLTRDEFLTQTRDAWPILA